MNNQVQNLPSVTLWSAWGNEIHAEGGVTLSPQNIAGQRRPGGSAEGRSL